MPMLQASKIPSFALSSEIKKTPDLIDAFGDVGVKGWPSSSNSPFTSALAPKTPFANSLFPEPSHPMTPVTSPLRISTSHGLLVSNICKLETLRPIESPTSSSRFSISDTLSSPSIW